MYFACTYLLKIKCEAEYPNLIQFISNTFDGSFQIESYLFY